jgi:cytochrome c oxidase subunit 3
MKYLHPYHIVGNSPWPFIISILMVDVIISIIMIIQNKIGGVLLLQWAFISINIGIFLWVKEIIIEGIYKGEHTKKVTNNLLTGFILFVISEIAIFTSLFFAYFYNSLIPSIELGSNWPPIGINILNPSSIPLFNTALLYFSGITITISQNYLHSRYKFKSLFYLYITIFLGISFSYFQYIEYIWAFYTISDSIYSSNFYMLTGFHGIHVIVGTILLIISLFRLLINHFNIENHLSFTCSVIYWHLVDYIWLILYISLYCWGI